MFPVSTGLLALQGQDDLGVFIRNNVKKLGVTTEFIRGECEVQWRQLELVLGAADDLFGSSFVCCSR